MPAPTTRRYATRHEAIAAALRFTTFGLENFAIWQEDEIGDWILDYYQPNNTNLANPTYRLVTVDGVWRIK